MRKVTRTIYWPIMLFMIIIIAGIDNEIFVILSILFYATLIVKDKYKFFIPKQVGIKLYLLFIVYSFIFGLVQYPLRYVIRDLYYILPTVIWILISYHLHRMKCLTTEKLIKTMFVYAGVNSLKVIVEFLLSGQITFNNLKSTFESNVYDVGIILPIIIMYVFILKRTLFSKTIDYFFILCTVLQILLSCGRIAILAPTIELFIILLLYIRYVSKQQSILRRILILTFSFIFGGIVLIKVLPQSITDPFFEKITKTFTEINTKQIISSDIEATNNWRAYEIQAAREQWKESNLFIKLFGLGLGTGIYLNYIPPAWRFHGLVENNQIPLLHNGFYTLLPKGGVFAITALALVFWNSISEALKKIRKRKNSPMEGIITVAVLVASISLTYVVRGPVQQGVFFIWAIIVGWFSVITDNTMSME